MRRGFVRILGRDLHLREFDHLRCYEPQALFDLGALAATVRRERLAAGIHDGGETASARREARARSSASVFSVEPIAWMPSAQTMMPIARSDR